MHHRSILTALVVCLNVVAPLAQAVTCAANMPPPSNPDVAYSIPVGNDGTVTHVPTGLVWKRCAEGQTWSDNTCTGSATTHSWAQALTLANTSSFAGQTDWRLPNLRELRSLVEECRVTPAINNTIFPGASSLSFWSGSPNPFSSKDAWTVRFDDGSVFNGIRGDNGNHDLVRLVRAGQSFGSLGTPTVASALPNTGTLGTTATITVNGSNLPATIIVNIASQATGCTRQSVNAAATQAVFTCPLTTAGSNLLFEVKTNAAANGGSAFYSNIFAVAAAANLPPIIKVGSVTLQSNGEGDVKVTFTVTDPEGQSVGYDAYLSNANGEVAGFNAASKKSLNGVVSGSPINVTWSAAEIAAGSLMVKGPDYVIGIDGYDNLGLKSTSRATSVTFGWLVGGAAVPGAPTNPYALAGDRQATINFNAPNNGGSPITGYTVTSTPGSIVATGINPPITVVGLTNGQSYTFTVKATNGIGTGAPSTLTSPITPKAPTEPNPVLHVKTAGLGNGTVTARNTYAVGTVNINCTNTTGVTSGTCDVTLVNGVNVTLTATPQTGSTFIGWSGDCNIPGLTCTLPMDASKTVTATFATVGACDASGVAAVAPNGYAFAKDFQAFDVTCQNGRYGIVRLPRSSSPGAIEVCAFQQSSCQKSANSCIASAPSAATLEAVYNKRNAGLDTLLSDPTVGPLAQWICQ